MRYVAYYRVSTAQQGRSGLGLEAQRQTILTFINGSGAEIIAEFTEVESGKRKDRPELTKAIREAELTGAKLVIAKLDRLSRNAAFLLQLQESAVEFVAADMPDANEMTVGIMAVVAQGEAKAISKRTKEALAAAKVRGVKLGNPKGAAHLKGRGNAEAVAARQAKAKQRADLVRPVVLELQEKGVTSLSGLTKALNERRIPAPNGGKWWPQTVKRIL